MNVLVVGHGQMGVNHARSLRRLGHAVTTVDPRPKARADLRSTPTRTKATHAVIATPAEQTPQLAHLLLNRGLKVLAEKPLAPTVSEALDLAQNPNIDNLHVGYLERLNPAVTTLRSHLPLVGRVRHVTARRLGPQPGRSLTTCLLDLASHDLDVVRSLGFTPTAMNRTEQDGHCIATLNMVDRHHQPVTGCLEASYLHPRKQRTLTIVGDDGMVTCDYQTQAATFVTPDEVTDLTVEKTEPLSLLHQAWLAERPGLASIRDAIAVLATLSTQAVPAK